MSLVEFAKANMLVPDGAMGTMLQAGQTAKDVHTAYLEAGANVILTNTFDNNTDAHIKAAVQIAKEVAKG